MSDSIVGKVVYYTLFALAAALTAAVFGFIAGMGLINIISLFQ